MNNTKLSLIALSALAFGVSAHANDGYVLFGDSAPKVEAQQKAVRPISAPYFHEDSFVTTDVRAWYLAHEFSDGTIGGDVTVAALQVRLALTESLQLVAYKDGYTEFGEDTAVLGKNDGWNDIGAGLKWAFLQDWENQLHAAVGVGYEFGFGDDEVLQETDELRLWASVNKGFDELHLGATVNYLVAMDDSEGVLNNSDIVTVHLHADYYVNEWFSPVVEVNGYFVADEGPAGPLGSLPFSGVDAVSIAGGENEDLITGAIGFELRPLGEDIGLRVAYETQLNDDTSLFGQRWTFSAVYEF